MVDFGWDIKAEYYKKDDMPSFAEALMSSDLVSMASERLFNAGYVIDPRTGKVRIPEGMSGVTIDSPWIIAYAERARNCGLFQNIFNIGKFVPKYCMNCYKVVVRPRTVKELFALYYAQIGECAKNKWPCKCGIERRPWTSWPYGGYFYTNGLEKGRERYVQVRLLVDKHLSPETDVILKRGCTEMELKCGPTDTYERPPHADAMEEDIRKMLDTKNRLFADQPEFLVRHIMLKWLYHAWRIGDMTCLEFNNGRPFYPKVVTYHNDLEEKHNAKKKEAT